MRQVRWGLLARGCSEPRLLPTGSGAARRTFERSVCGRALRAAVGPGPLMETRALSIGSTGIISPAHVRETGGSGIGQRC